MEDGSSSGIVVVDTPRLIEIDSMISFKIEIDSSICNLAGRNSK